MSKSAQVLAGSERLDAAPRSRSSSSSKERRRPHAARPRTHIQVSAAAGATSSWSSSSRPVCRADHRVRQPHPQRELDHHHVAFVMTRAPGRALRSRLRHVLGSCSPLRQFTMLARASGRALSLARAGARCVQSVRQFTRLARAPGRALEPRSRTEHRVLSRILSETGP